MKLEVLKNLVQEGKRPLVRLTDCLWDDSFGNKGMIARVVSAVDEPHDLVQFGFDFNENREHNLALDPPSWYLSDDDADRLGRKQGTAVESGFFDNPDNLLEEVSFDKGQDIPVELVEGETPLALWLAEGGKGSYVEWLEKKLEALVPDCMKDWKKGL